ncbi:hypothetical protein QWJ26_19700 [Streptomyces sp. CSDS2]|uniref:hypothetical protein n=1 Tax=Streptomyces sp. CSDS2 TaxID=3055051 RepID=UPI0025B260EA|nr:hypothetical protein [Streptomyces sp. CSDS2]MDN3261994.1 hypothetical protein [Streptomyces sp. CSDS2]
MIAIAAVLVDIVLILTHRVRTSSEPVESTTWRHMAAGLAGCAAGWLVIGRPHIVWDDLSLTLICGVVLASEAAHAARSLSGRAWAGWTTACASGAAAATWLLPGPLPFS